MNVLKTIHGFFANESSYLLWCKLTGNKPNLKNAKNKKDKKIIINNNYDVEKRERKND